MTFLLAYLYVLYVIFLSMVVHMRMKLMNTFGNWLIEHSTGTHQPCDWKPVCMLWRLSPC